MEIWKRSHDQTNAKNDQGTLDNFENQIALASALFYFSRKSKCDRDADDKKKERKDEISRRPAVPFGVLKWSIDSTRAWIIHQDHRSHGYASKHIERQ